jgi:hypothetical protein
MEFVEKLESGRRKGKVTYSSSSAARAPDAWRGLDGALHGVRPAGESVRPNVGVSKS